ncbi:uncharacterized protein LOC141714443 [Apium graveolens]|uniref:uncharacterized protein LOC141714443 n=1 Tax=Apium graveolens TaxID=4045 RepID=UPI003D7AB3E5
MDPIGYNVVKAHMIHGPCGKDFSYSPCMVKGKCGRHFPKKYNVNTFFDVCGFVVYRRRRTEASVLNKGVLLDNHYIVPYNRDLLLRFHCHINLEVCNSSRSLKYLFKYCLKGHDTATMLLRKKNKKDTPDEMTTKAKSMDEIKNFLDGRYICASEAAWRFLGFDRHHRFPSVERLPVHMEDEKCVSFKPHDDLGDVAERAKIRFTKLEGWMLLMHIKGATSYQDLKTVNEFVHNSFQEACDALGLLKDDRQWDVAMSENAVHAMPQIEKLFNDVGKSLKDYNSMHFPDDSFMHGLDNRLLSDELSYNKEHEHEEHDKLYKSLNTEQLHVYASIIDSVENGKGGIFFVYGSGGCKKTFLWNTLCCKLRSVEKVVLHVASSGIAAMLLPGGRTTHSRFHIPLKVDEYSVAGIKHGTELGELLKQTSLIIWDEAPMQHRHAAESVDRSLRDIMTSVDREKASLPFGCITIVFRGDFRQILPVIPKASRAQVVSASLNSSKIWDHCRVF